MTKKHDTEIAAKLREATIRIATETSSPALTSHHHRLFALAHDLMAEAVQHLEQGVGRSDRAMATLKELRAVGLTVAVHNDYRVDGRAHTFWLMTTERAVDEPGGCAAVHAFKGEGASDMEALDQIWVAWATATGAPRSPVAVADETEAERQVRRCAEALGYIGEPDRLAVVVGDACLAFAKDLREINARYMARISKLEESLAVERNKTPINKAAPLAERLRLVRALESLGWPVGPEPEPWAEQRAQDFARAESDAKDVAALRAENATIKAELAARNTIIRNMRTQQRLEGDIKALNEVRSEQSEQLRIADERIKELRQDLKEALRALEILGWSDGQEPEPWAEQRDARVAERLRNIMSTCFDGSRSGDLAFQLDDMEEWIPKFTSEWKANHRRWLDLCDRLGFDALDLAQNGRVAEVDAVAGDAFELRRIRAIVEDDARKRHGDREGEPSWGVIADCVLGHASQHRRAREILGVPEQFTLDHHVAEISRYLRGFEASRVNVGHWDTHPELPLDLLAREVVAQAERWRIDAEHYRGEASNATAKQVEALSAEVARLTGEVAATQAEARRQIDRALLERDAAVASRDDAWHHMDRDLIEADAALRVQVSKSFGHVHLPPKLPLLLWFIAGCFETTCQMSTQAHVWAEWARNLTKYDDGTDDKLRAAVTDRLQEAEKALTVVGWPGGDPIGWANKVREDAVPSSLTVAMYEAVASDLGRQLLRKCASNNDLGEEIGRKDQAMHDLSRQFMEYSQLVDRYKMAMVRLGSATEIAAALEWASTVSPFSGLEAPPLTPTAAPKRAASAEVERLDYSRFPPGYSGETTIVDAWGEWKLEHDPPGITLFCHGQLWSWQLDSADEAFEGTYPSADEARAAAWAWYDRRLAIVRALDAMSKGGYSRANWPRCLTWSRVQVDEIERWLADPEPFTLLPVVLRG